MGCRLLRQDPIECLFSFLCSSNNNIPRITKMLEALRVNFGTRLGEVGGRTYHSFPTLSQLLDATEPRLRALGFGYRAKFIVQSAQFIAAQPGGAEWLRALRDRTREEAHAELLKLCGVGPKVADCVSLFCLDKLDVVPVDVHVWKIAAVDYGAEFEAGFAERTLTKRVYASVGDFFRRRLGTHCGWAHSILFTADLHAFQSRLPVALRRTLPAVVASGAKNKAKAKAKAKAKSAADEATETMSELKEEDASSVQPSAAAAVASTKGGRKRKTELAVKSEAASSDEHIAAPKEASKKPRKSAAPKSALKSET